MMVVDDCVGMGGDIIRSRYYMYIYIIYIYVYCHSIIHDRQHLQHPFGNGDANDSCASAAIRSGGYIAEENFTKSILNQRGSGVSQYSAG